MCGLVIGAEEFWQPAAAIAVRLASNEATLHAVRFMVRGLLENRMAI